MIKSIYVDFEGGECFSLEVIDTESRKRPLRLSCPVATSLLTPSKIIIIPCCPAPLIRMSLHFCYSFKSYSYQLIIGM